ncbi:WhiB family transcriptional regulator [Streptomyces sp. NPDC060198]|uniref:WhiB family transcriptional regulator n=1 Tax=Streptomyces sp. NPDC060198 TaxID=3347070 RepID=UPI003649D198
MNKTTARAEIDSQAICAQTDPEIFFPEKGHGDVARAAKRICVGCPVRRACLAEALATEGDLTASSRHGVLGGHTPQERARIAKSWRTAS